VTDELLHHGLELLGLAGTAQVGPEEHLRRYLGEIERWSSRLGLVNATGEALIVRHVLDSLAGLGTVRELLSDQPDPVIADVGTGGGFPGVPLACFLPEARVLLVERSGRKCGFLRGALPAAGIRNAEVVQSELERLDREATVVTCRAFRPLVADVRAGLLRVTRPGGAVCAYKGRRETIETELADATAATGDVEIVRLQVPLLAEERHLVILRRER
jgi:16S rRNA (guanine527-N7)-methyltransferase